MLRLSFGRVFTYLLVLALIILVPILIWNEQVKSFYEILTMILASISILSGIIYGIWDIIAFDSDNIFFFLDDRRRNDIRQRLVSNLRLNMNEVDQFYERVRNIFNSKPYREMVKEMNKKPEMAQIFESNYIVNQEKDVQKKLADDYHSMKEIIPDENLPVLISQILDKGNYITARELRSFISEYNLQLEHIRDFAGQLKKKISGLEQLLGNETGDNDKGLGVPVVH